ASTGPRQHAAVVAVVRQHANLGSGERGIGLDAVDQRGAARRRGKEALERNQARPTRRDRFERLECLRIREDEHVGIGRVRPLPERGHDIGCRDENRTGLRHDRPVYNRASMGQPPYLDVTVGDLLGRLARALPSNEAIVYTGGPRYTFVELDREARAIARGLMALGVARGERVVLWATNVPEWVVLQFALAKIGAILVTANTSLRAREIEYLLRQSEAATLVTIRGFRDVDYIGALTAIGALGGALPALKRLIYIGGDAPAGYLPYETLRLAAAAISDGDLDRRSGSIAVDDVINMQYTSGTTGFPKGVMLTSRNI